MDAPDSYTLVVHIGADSPPSLIAAVRSLIEQLQSANGSEQREAAVIETEFVTHPELVSFIERSGEPVGDKANRIWRQLVIPGSRNSLADRLEIVCFTCDLSRSVCSCFHNTRKDWYHPGWHKQWKIGRQSLLALNASMLTFMHVATRQRLLAFIDSLR